MDKDGKQVYLPLRCLLYQKILGKIPTPFCVLVFCFIPILILNSICYMRTKRPSC